MSENSHLRDANPDFRVSALGGLIEWIDREGSTARGVELVRTLARHDLDALALGQEPEPCDAAQLVARWRLSPPGRGADIGALVRKAKPLEALERRRASLRQYLSDRGIEFQPAIEVLQGGGRGNTSRYRLRWDPITEPDDASSAAGDVSYRSERARASLPLRWLLNDRGFVVGPTSPRTWAFMVLCLVPTALALLMLVLALVLMLVGRRDLNNAVAVVGAVLIAWFLWREGRALLQFPNRRAIAAPASLLAMSQMHGQILFGRRVRGDRREVKLRLVRLWATCPDCGGDVDLADGGTEFPGRLVGRCGDAPGEHVFSFDPTSMAGRSLRS